MKTSTQLFGLLLYLFAGIIIAGVVIVVLLQ